MIQCNKLSLFVFALILIMIMLSSTGIAFNGSNDQAAIENFRYWHNQDPLVLANNYLDKLQTAYETENLPLFLSLYNDPFVTVDVIMDSNDLYTIQSARDEIEQMFAMFSGIKCSFADRKITFEGDMIMIRTMRSFSANEFPMTAKCDMLMVLRKSYSPRQFWNFVAIDQMLLKEEYVPLPEQATVNSLNTLASPEVKAEQSTENHLFW